MHSFFEHPKILELINQTVITLKDMIRSIYLYINFLMIINKDGKYIRMLFKKLKIKIRAL